MIKDYIALDIETTGLSPVDDKIIELGMAKVTDGEVTETFNMLFNPDRKLPERIVSLTGIHDEDLQGRQKIEGVLDEIEEFMGELPILGHNVIFDYSFLSQVFADNKRKFVKNGIDTLAISKVLLSTLEQRNLAYLCEYFDINPGNSHRALDDAISAHRLYQKLGGICGDSECMDRCKELVYKAKKSSPITAAQKKYLSALVSKYNINLEEPIEEMTKSKASRMIDGIISRFGK